MGETRCVYRVLLFKREGERPFGRPRHRWEDMKNRSVEVGLGWGGHECNIIIYYNIIL
jgi:hypothetical protein